MTEVITHDRATKRGNGAKRQPKPDKVHRVADDIVTPNSLATHLGCTRQNIARLVAETVLIQRSDGNFDQTANRLRYIKHLRENHRHTPRSKADAEHIAVKTQMLQLRLMERQKELVKLEDHNARIEGLTGLMLTHLSGWPARIAGHDLVLRRRADALLFELRRAMAEAANTLADQEDEPKEADK
jgi:hypothetical protein